MKHRLPVLTSPLGMSRARAQPPPPGRRRPRCTASARLPAPAPSAASLAPRPWLASGQPPPPSPLEPPLPPAQELASRLLVASSAKACVSDCPMAHPLPASSGCFQGIALARTPSTPHIAHLKKVTEAGCIAPRGARCYLGNGRFCSCLRSVWAGAEWDASAARRPLLPQSAGALLPDSALHRGRLCKASGGLGKRPRW